MREQNVREEQLMPRPPPLMRLERVTKTFPNGTVALRGVDLEIEAGEVHGLLGANGAGKSTLIKILSGAMLASGGQLTWKGAAVSWNSPRAANETGLATLHQHIPLVPTLSVIENVFLGVRGGWRRSVALQKRFDSLCDRIGYELDADRMVSELSIGQRQMVAVFQALGSGAELIVMDEPTASLAAGERELVYRAIRRLSRTEQRAILFVSHFLDEIMDLTDRVTILRDGQAVLHANTCDLDEARIADAIVGKQLVKLEQRTAAQTAHTAPASLQPRLELRDLATPGKVEPISLRVAAGEVIGIAGLLGSGRSELLHAIFGADSLASGEVCVNGRPIRRTIAGAVGAGIALVPEDRNRQGLVPNFEIWRNTTLPALKDVAWFGLMPLSSREHQRGRDVIGQLAIKADSPDLVVAHLSGGNAQKVTIGKWLYNDVQVLLLDEPTAGIDIGAKTDILNKVRQLADEGRSVILVSSEFEELLKVADRILVLRCGKYVAERKAHETTAQELLLLAGGQSAGHSPRDAARVN